ncbi:MAG: hypothetical protein R2818_01420 [Flavobacteriales bacterium]
MNTKPFSPALMRYSIGALLTLALTLVFAIDAYSQVSETFTTSGTFTVPAGVTQVTVECWGGGGRGGTRTTNGRGGGGGGGAYVRSNVSVSPGNYTVTVGAGSNSTSAGGDSWFSTATTVMAKGGNSVGDNVSNGASGGSAASSIGTVKFSGGNGANAPGGTGAGGGSSAGIAANGDNASGQNGGIAPSGGGDGGNGGNGFVASGSNGSGPGGGGGGAERGCCVTAAGGSGADGQVIITYTPPPYVNGTCMSAGSSNAIPDNACGSNPRTLQTVISGLPTTMGTAPGNVRLTSVELIVAHTYNADLEISLTSPGSATRNLIADHFGSGDNLGDPSACPGSPFVLADGGTALTTANTSNVVGTYAPLQTLAGFTGNPNGTWILTVCDDANLDLGNVLYLKLNFCTVPQITASSSNSPVCATGTLNLSVSATGTAPLTYAWTGGGAFSPNAASPTPSVTSPVTGNYNITVSNSCGSTNTNVPVSVTAPRTATISYAGSPYCQNAGTASVSRSGSAGGTYSASPAGLSINSGNGQVTLGTSSPGAYTVTYAIAASGGCPLFSTTTSITVNAASIYYNDTDGDGFGDPADFVSSCVPVAGRVLDNTDDCPLVFGKIGDACDDSNINTINDQINGSCVCAGTNTPWYSQGSGTFADPIWSHNIGGPGAVASLNSGSNVVIQSGHTVNVAGMQSVADLTVQSGATLTLGANALNVFGTSVTIDGTLGGGTGTLVLQPSAAATLAGSGAVNLYDLTVNAPSGLNCTANVGIRGTLQLNNGVFTATGPVRLVSNATGTGRLGPVAATASYSGNLTVNRFIPAGATNWRMLGSSVGGQTINDLKDDFFTAGFPGSHYPAFFSPVGSTNLWPSIRWYNETNAGSAVNDGLVGATGAGQALATGQGFAAWSGSTFTTTTAFTIDFTGPPHVASTPITLPMTWTNTGVPATDGWNMVSNPLPSPVRFDQLVRGADVEDYITYYDPATGNNATYDISLGAGINGGTNIIQSSQGFWLKANGPAVTTTVNESAKVAGNTGGFFGGDQVQTARILSLEIASTINQYRDQTLIVFSEGTPATESDDVPKFVFAHPEAPQVASMGPEGNFYAINCYGPYSNDISIPVSVNVAVNGNYTLTANGLDDMGLSCVRLEDLATGTITPLEEGTSYTFTALATDDEHIARFLIHATAPLTFDLDPATCAGFDNGVASVEITDGPVHIQWVDEGGLVLLDQENVMPGTSSIAGLAPGNTSCVCSATPVAV